MADAPAGSYLLLHGLEGSGEGHWQRWLAPRLAGCGAAVAFPDLPDADDPDPSAWESELARVLGEVGEPPVVLAHSLGCVLWLRHASRAGERVAERVLLVAPPATEAVPAVVRFSAFDPDPARVREAATETRIVCSDDDPYNPVGALKTHAEPLGLPVEVVAGAGHLNVDAGYGPWPAVERWALG
jgi:predicted alpha/beta hydrolase family esterase